MRANTSVGLVAAPERRQTISSAHHRDYAARARRQTWPNQRDLAGKLPLEPSARKLTAAVSPGDELAREEVAGREQRHQHCQRDAPAARSASDIKAARTAI